jgi:hypothetical protein
VLHEAKNGNSPGSADVHLSVRNSWHNEFISCAKMVTP